MCFGALHLSMQIMLLGALNVYVTSSQDGMLKLWSSDTLKPMRTIQNGNGGMFHFILALHWFCLLVTQLQSFMLHLDIEFCSSGFRDCT
jgi:hypothetical protein